MSLATLSPTERDIGIDIVEAKNLTTGNEAAYKLRTNIAPATIVGSVYINDKHVGVFTHEQDGTCRIIDPYKKMVSVTVDCKTGEVFIVWLDPVPLGASKIVVSYEYFPQD